MLQVRHSCCLVVRKRSRPVASLKVIAIASQSTSDDLHVTSDSIDPTTTPGTIVNLQSALFELSGKYPAKHDPMFLSQVPGSKLTPGKLDSLVLHSALRVA